MLALLFFPVALHFLMHSTTAQNSEITCPATGFTVGVNATVTCKVKKADFVSACTLAATLINFYFTPSNGAKSEWCSSSYKTCPNTGTTQVACGTCSCGCETDDGTFLIHRLDFIPTLAHAAGNFSCEVICVNTGNLPTLANNDCDQVKVATPTMPPTTETTEHPGTTTASTESPSSNTATSGPATQHTGNNSPSEAATETTGNVSSATTASSEPSSSPSSISGPTTTSTENSSTNNTTGNVGSTTGPASDLALYAGLGFMGLVCLVGIVVVIVLIVRRRKRRKDIATNSGNHSSPDQSGENNYTYINNTAL